MNTDRLFNLVMMDMSLDKLKLEEELERVINDKQMMVEDKTSLIKTTLYKLSNTENAIATFSNLLNNNNNNKKED